MIRFGHKDTVSYFEEVSFPVIILNTDLSVEYMNSEAENCYGKYFRKPDWKKVYLDKELSRQIIHAIEKGETVVVTPPQIKDFSMLLFQPLIGKDGKPECVRLNVEVFCDIRRKFERYRIHQSLLDNVYNETRDILQSMKMAVTLLKNENNKEKLLPYYNLLESGIKDFNNSIMCIDYLYDLMKRHDISKEAIFNPRTDIQKIIKSIPNIKYTDLLGDTGLVICDRHFLENAIKTITEFIQNVARTETVKLKAYEADPHFVFIFSAKKHHDIPYNIIEIQNLHTLVNTIKLKTEENGGNLIINNADTTVTVMYSIKKHLRSEYSMIFNQDQIQL